MTEILCQYLYIKTFKCIEQLVAPVWVRLVLQSGTTLQSEMQTNKPLELLKDDLPDVQIWNDRLSLKVVQRDILAFV